MADDDNFDIDIYGDDDHPDSTSHKDAAVNDAGAPIADTKVNEPNESAENAKSRSGDQKSIQQPSEAINGDANHDSSIQQIASTGGSAVNTDVHKQAPQQQGTKRKQGEDDDRPTDPGATAALMVNDINWWISEEDIRGWANQSRCEDELIEVTFNEHKVNGKSKCQVYIQLRSPQAATALKHQIEQLFKDQTHTKKPSAIFNPPQHNPFKTLPKDVPQRDKGRNDRSTPGAYNNQGSGNFNKFNNNNRGNFNNHRGGNMVFANNRNFSNPAGGNMSNGMGAYGGQPPMNSFGNPMGMNNFGGNFNRGGMMGSNMRGGLNNRGRGGAMGMNTLGAGSMGGMNMPMGGNMMGMGGNMMGMGGSMGMMGGMGGNFAGSPPQFNPTFFQGNQGAGDGNWQNPHGAKRPRPE